MDSVLVFQKKISFFWILLFVSIFQYFLVINLPIFLGDSALYASISKNLFLSGNWYELATQNNGSWLDKPHFPFWIQVLFYQIFGINEFGYRISGFVFLLAATYYLYLLHSIENGKKSAQIAVLIFLSSFHIWLAVADLRAELYLLAFLLMSMYYFQIYEKTNKWRHLFNSGFFLGIAAITKGIFIVIVFWIALTIHYFLSKKRIVLSRLFFWIFWISVPIFFELLALYKQFGFSRNILVNGVPTHSWLSFFFIESQFGRFLSTGPVVRGQRDIFYFLHTSLWAFFPWSFYLIYIVWIKIKKLKLNSIYFQSKSFSLHFWIVFGLFLAFSLSEFQLSHYVVVLIPYLSSFVSMYFSENQYSIFFLNIKFFKSIFLTAILFYCILSIFVMPKILQYQSEYKAINTIQKYNNKKVGIYESDPHLFHFINPKNTIYHHHLDSVIQVKNLPMLLFTTPNIENYIKEKNVRYSKLDTYIHMPVSRPNLAFLFKNDSNNVDYRVLLLIEKK